VTADGHYTVSWSSFTGVQHQIFVESAPPLADAAPGLISAATATLGASTGWTGAAVLSNGSVAVAGAQDGGWGSHVGAVQVYDASGGLTGSVSGIGYGAAGAAFAPQVAALGAGGLYEVSFAGSTDYDVYTAAGQLAWTHNAYTSA